MDYQIFAMQDKVAVKLTPPRSGSATSSSPTPPGR